MGMCKPSGGKIDIYGPYRSNIKDMYGTPNTRVDYYDEVTGELLQQRWYGPDGRAVLDRDWSHGNGDDSHTFPHDHYWDWTKNELHPDRPKHIGSNGELTNHDYC